MSKEIDEDLIEATIRKVAEARAARGQDAGAGNDDGALPEDLSKWDDEAAAIDDDAVAATLARIQPQPPRQPEPPASDDDLSKWDAKAAAIDDDAVAATLARIQAQSPREPEPPASDDDLSKWDDKAAAIDDDAVAATLARIQAQPPREPEPVASDDDLSKWDARAAAIDDDAVAATLARIQPRESQPTGSGDDRSKWDGVRAPTAEAAAPTVDHLRDATVVAELQGLLEQTIARVAALEAQVASLSATVHSLTSGTAAPPVPSQPARADDDWDDVPPPASSGFGTPQRPTVLRDPSPWSATAAKLEPAETPAASAPAVSAQAEELPAPEVQRPRLHAIGGGDPPQEQPQRSGFDLLPKTYRITIEDKRRNVDLVPLHRALLGIDGVRDMSLLSYANGAAIVSVETLGDLTPESLQRAVSHAMARDAEVQVHNETTMVVKIAEE